MVEDSVLSYILSGISHTGCYTYILFTNGVLRKIKFPIWTDHLFVLNNFFNLEAENNRHP
jgi:hypothetical protein